MAEEEFRKEYGLSQGELISTSNGLADIFGVGKDPTTGEEMVALGFLAGGRVINEPVKSVIEKLKNPGKKENTP